MCVLLSPRLHEEVIEVLIVSICKQLCEGRKLFFSKGQGSISSMLCWTIIFKTGFVCAACLTSSSSSFSASYLTVRVFLSSGENLPTSFYFHMTIIAGLVKRSGEFSSTLSLSFTFSILLIHVCLLLHCLNLSCATSLSMHYTTFSVRHTRATARPATKPGRKNEH